MIVARLEGNNNILEVSEKLKALEYEVVSISNKSLFVSREKTSSSDLARDIKSAKSSSKYSGSIKCFYGSNSTIC